MKKRLHPVHPGEVLPEEFLNPMSLSQNRLALNIGVLRRPLICQHFTNQFAPASSFSILQLNAAIPAKSG
jgi:hypothetical protein